MKWLRCMACVAMLLAVSLMTVAVLTIVFRRGSNEKSVDSPYAVRQYGLGAR